MHAFCYCIATCILALTQHKHNMRREKQQTCNVYKTRRVFRRTMYDFSQSKFLTLDGNGYCKISFTSVWCPIQMIIFHSNESFLLASFLLPKTRDKKDMMAAKYAITRGHGKLRDFIKSFCEQRCWYAEVACWTVGVVECGGSETKGRCGSMLLFCRHSWPQLASYTSHNIAHRRI